MNPNQFTLKLQEAFQAAQSLAGTKNHAELSSLHLMSALLTDRNSLFQGVFIGASVLAGLRGCNPRLLAVLEKIDAERPEGLLTRRDPFVSRRQDAV